MKNLQPFIVVDVFIFIFFLLLFVRFALASRLQVNVKKMHIVYCIQVLCNYGLQFEVIDWYNGHNKSLTTTTI